MGTGDRIAEALRAALELAVSPAVAAAWGEAALEAARGPLSLTRFVAAVDREARARTGVASSAAS